MSTRARSEQQDARELPQEQWAPFFEDINRRVEDGADIQATIEIVSTDVVGPEAANIPLESITHEDGDDEIAIGVGGRGERFPTALWHFVSAPRHVWIMERDGMLDVIAIQSEDGTRTLIHLYGATGG
jgi:Family of unknown function (DUF5335)